MIDSPTIWDINNHDFLSLNPDGTEVNYIGEVIITSCHIT